MEDKIKNYIRGIIMALVPIDKREVIVNEIYNQTKESNSIYNIEYVIKGILLKYQQNKEKECGIVRVSKDISEYLMSGEFQK